MTECDRNICYRQDYNGGCETCPCNIDVPETEQAIEAIKTIKKFCQQVTVEDCEKEKCPIRKWCNQHITNGVPEEWEDEAGEQE